MSAQPSLANLAVVLAEPKFEENIGAAARVCRNMGVGTLVVVTDRSLDQGRMLKMATHNASRLIDDLKVYQDLPSALAGFSWVVGTTARLGRQRREVATPRQMAEEVAGLLPGNQVALLFGPEDRGLSNLDLALCNQLSSIPTVAFSSLNLAQAVAIHCYELAMAAMLQSGRRGTVAPRRASNQELEAMYGHVEQVLRTVGFLKETDYQYWLRNIRQFLGRIGLRAREARIVRGVCRQFLWYERQRQESERGRDGIGNRPQGKRGKSGAKKTGSVTDASGQKE